MRKTWGVKHEPIPKQERKEAWSYELTPDRMNMIAHGSKSFWMVKHSTMTKLEKWIWKLLVRQA